MGEKLKPNFNSGGHRNMTPTIAVYKTATFRHFNFQNFGSGILKFAL